MSASAKQEFYPGLLYVILDWIALKMSHYSATDKYLCLVLDKVQISQGIEYELSLKQFVGTVSADLVGASKTEKTYCPCHSCIMLYGKRDYNEI